MVPVSSFSPIAASAATVKKSAQNSKQQFLYLLLSFVKDMISSIHQQAAMTVSKSSIDIIFSSYSVSSQNSSSRVLSSTLHMEMQRLIVGL